MMKEEVQLAQEEKNWKECMKCHTHAKRRKEKKYGMEANKKKLNSHACKVSSTPKKLKFNAYYLKRGWKPQVKEEKEKTIQQWNWFQPH